MSKVVVAVLAGAGLAVAPTLSSPAVAAPQISRDGSSSSRAAASCWEIKQNFPAEPDGVYWLQTPQLVAPQQFYCDQTTDGGGWVLIGRGRDGWDWTHNGEGTASSVYTTPTGTGAFVPATVPGDTVEALLGGTRVDALPDGVRIRRATNEAGTSWQEMRLMESDRADWSWAIGGGIHVSSISVDGTSYPATNTQSWADGTNQGLLRLTATDLKSHNYHQGFSYGSTITGENNATSYLWQYADEGAALPFTQVWIRPKLVSPSYSAIPDAGTAATTVRALLSNATSPTTTWGVTGIAPDGTGLDAKEEIVEVEDFAFIGRTVYVAGKFEYVKHGASGADIDQPYLASFNVDTGEWNSAFRPKLNGTAWTLATTPDGRLFVGGSFTNANGSPNTKGLAEVDPTTGATVSGWNTDVDYEGDNTPYVRSIAVEGNWLYIGGRFNRIDGGTLKSALSVGELSRMSLTTNTPDTQWAPHVDGTIYELDPSSQGDRVYFVGNFDNVNFETSSMRGVVSTAPGAANIPGLQPGIVSTGSGTDLYQQTILEVGNDVWQGGSQHVLTKYNRSDYSSLGSNITRNGGDFQELDYKDGVIYGACHCMNYAYSGTSNYSSPIASATDVNDIKFIGAWDEKTGAYLPDFSIPTLTARLDDGPWAFKNGPDDCMWFGGDFTGGSFHGSGHEWLGGFGKICPRDTTAPTTPTNLAATATGSGVNLTWGASTDASSLTYEVLRGDRVVATTTSRSWTDVDGYAPTKYWVRAVDADGNRSASTPDVAVSGDTTPPSQVDGLTATAKTAPSAVALSWSAATDDTGVAGYVVNRNGSALPGLVTGTTFNDDLVTPSTAYTYTVQAEDAAGNLGPASSVASVSTGPDATVLYQNSWTTAKDGAGWSSKWVKTTKSGTFSTKSNQGTVGFSDKSGAYAKARLNVASQSGAELLTTFRWTTAAASSYLTFYLRGSGGWENTYAPKNGYGVQISPLSTTVTLLKTAKGKTSTIGTVKLPQTIGTTRQWLRFRTAGSRIEFKLWATNTAEPSAWTLAETSKTVTAKGQFSISLRRNSSNKGGKTVDIDNFSVRSR